MRGKINRVVPSRIDVEFVRDAPRRQHFVQRCRAGFLGDTSGQRVINLVFRSAKLGANNS